MSFSGQQLRRDGGSAPAGRVQPVNSRPEGAKGAGQAQMPPRGTWFWFVLALLVNYALVKFLFPAADAPITVPYTFFKEEVRKGNIQAVFGQGEMLTGR